MSTFTAQHYEEVAKLLRETKQVAMRHYGDSGAASMWANIVYMFVGLFKYDNPRFDPHAFLKACGMYEKSADE